LGRGGPSEDTGDQEREEPITKQRHVVIGEEGEARTVKGLLRWNPNTRKLIIVERNPQNKKRPI